MATSPRAPSLRRLLRRVIRSGAAAGSCALAALFFVELATARYGFVGFHGQRAIALVMERARSHAIQL